MERPASRRKQKHKGVQCRRGKPLYYGELKQHCNLMLTQTALDKLEELALSSNISRSEVIEQWLRSQIQEAEVNPADAGE